MAYPGHTAPTPPAAHRPCPGFPGTTCGPQGCGTCVHMASFRRPCDDLPPQGPVGPVGRACTHTHVSHRSSWRGRTHGDWGTSPMLAKQVGLAWRSWTPVPARAASASREGDSPPGHVVLRYRNAGCKLVVSKPAVFFSTLLKSTFLPCIRICQGEWIGLSALRPSQSRLFRSSRLGRTQDGGNVLDDILRVFICGMCIDG